MLLLPAPASTHMSPWGRWLSPIVGAAPQPKRFIPTPPVPPCLCRAYPYVALVNNFAQAWALYCLVLLYQASAAAGC